MHDDFFKILGIILVGFFVIYMSVKMLKFQTSMMEGLTNPLDTINSLSSNTVIGETASAASHAASIKAYIVKLQDELLFTKYKKDYETTIINLDDLIGTLMIKQLLNINIGNNDDMIKSLSELNTLKSARDSLNVTMNFLDNLKA